MNSSHFIPAERIVLLKQQQTAGRYVLYWMQTAQRCHENPALEFAIQQANGLGLPLVTVFCLTPDYPEANLRHYTFMLEGLLETFEDLRARGIKAILCLGHPPDEMVKWTANAKLAVVDKGYLRHLQQWYDRFAQKADCTVYQVEGEAVVPVRVASTKAEFAARTIRPRIQRHLADFLFGVSPTKVEQSANSLQFEHGLEVGPSDLSSLLAGIDIDRSVGPSAHFRGGNKEARKRFTSFLNNCLKKYDDKRNQPQTNFTSLMSPYLHYGMISPVYLALTLSERNQSNDPNIESYLEELIVRRGLGQNFTLFTPNYDSFACLPDWAIKTLKEHASDPRPDLCSRVQLEAAATHDPYWNAAQVEMVETGYMHNYMRMYWGKKILEWSATPEEAYDTTLYLNNKYQLDGRDPTSFGSVAWIFGLHDRAWFERPIFGEVRTMMASGLERKNDPKGYVDKIERLTKRPIKGKFWLF